MWDINKSKYLENNVLDFEQAKKKHEEDLRKNKIINVEELEIKNDNYDENTIQQYLNKRTSEFEIHIFFVKIFENFLVCIFCYIFKILTSRRTIFI